MKRAKSMSSAIDRLADQLAKFPAEEWARRTSLRRASQSDQDAQMKVGVGETADDAPPSDTIANHTANYNVADSNR